MAYAAQEVLLQYQAHFGADKPLDTVQTSRLGIVRFEIRVTGEQYNPFAQTNEEAELMRTLLARMQLAPTWVYKNGCNRIIFTRQKEKTLGTFAQMMLAIVSAVILGLGFSSFAPELGAMLADGILAPAFDALMGLITTMAALLIFVSVINSICGLSDLSTLSRIGKTLLLSMMKWLTLCSAFVSAAMMLLFTFRSSGGSGIDLFQIYQMFLDIVPKNLVEPMLTSNTMQILALAVIFGISILTAGETVGTVTKLLSELENVIQRTTLTLISMLPAIMFISFFRIFALGQYKLLISSAEIPLIYILLAFGWFAIQVIRICITCGVSPVVLLKKLMPTFMQGFLTASSAAALFQNMSCCEKELGIDKKLVSFGVPLGQVIYMPSIICDFAPMVFCIAEIFGIEMTWMQLLTEAILAVLLSIALPPIPGSGMLCFSILMNQLGIPLAGLAIALPLDALMDHLGTGLNLNLLQLELVSAGNQLGMLDKTVLRRSGEK